MRQKGFVLVQILVVVILLGALGYFIYQNTQLKSLLPNKVIPNPVPTSEAVNTSPKPSKTPNLNGNTYTSESLGIEFDYATYLDADKTVKTLISETGSKIYVYASTLQSPSQGQSIEVFAKEPKDSLKTAIEKRFLSGISKDDCFVETKTDSDNQNTIQATISYPWPDKNEPKFLFGEKCPENYKESNGISYFEMDTNHPSSFIYVSIGQQPGPSSSNLPNSPEWFKSIRFLK